MTVAFYSNACFLWVKKLLTIWGRFCSQIIRTCPVTYGVHTDSCRLRATVCLNLASNLACWIQDSCVYKLRDYLLILVK